MNSDLRTWQPGYNLGIEDIDLQHHFFFNLIHRIAKELRSSEDRLYRNALILELSAYARFHFLSEENMMHRSRFPGLEEHKLLHLELLDRLSTKGNMFLVTNAAKDSEAIVHFLVDWFLHHTTSIDKTFAAWKQKNQA